MTFPILQETDLPVLGSKCERSDIDFKAMVDSSDTLELAKGIAALANTVGGSVVIGASTRGSQLLDYPGIAKKDAGKIPEAYEKAATNRCRPAPQVASNVLPRGSRVVVVINIWPAAVHTATLAPIGFSINQSVEGARLLVHAWAFPSEWDRILASYIPTNSVHQTT